MPNKMNRLVVMAAIAIWMHCSWALAQVGLDGSTVQGQNVPREVREIYERGLQWLENNQDDKGG